MQTVRVLLVDSSQPFLNSAAQFLDAVPEIQVVGRLVSSHETLATNAELRPDLVLIDLSMPEMSGLVVMVRLKALPDPPRVIIVTDYDQVPYRDLAEAVQADGFVAKREFATRLVPLIRKLFATPALRVGACHTPLAGLQQEPMKGLGLVTAPAGCREGELP